MNFSVSRVCVMWTRVPGGALKRRGESDMDWRGRKGEGKRVNGARDNYLESEWKTRNPAT